jgi:Cdc6-like AAA superfamily ATPase
MITGPLDRLPFDERIRQYAARHNLLDVDARYMVDLLREAVLAERERCAKVVEQYHVHGQHANKLEWCHCADTAAAIRGRPAP